MQTPYRDLERLRCDLERQTSKKKIEEILYKMCKVFIKSEFKINYTQYIRPAFVEAYYFKREIWEDCSIDFNENQKNSNKFFVSEDKNGKGRIDFCFGKNDAEEYYLSFLIKYTLLNEDETIQNQTKTKDLLRMFSIENLSDQTFRYNYSFRGIKIIQTFRSNVNPLKKNYKTDYEIGFEPSWRHSPKEYVFYKFAKIAALRSDLNLRAYKKIDLKNL